ISIMAAAQSCASPRNCWRVEGTVLTDVVVRRPDQCAKSTVLLLGERAADEHLLAFLRIEVHIDPVLAAEEHRDALCLAFGREARVLAHGAFELPAFGGEHLQLMAAGKSAGPDDLVRIAA